MRKYLVAQSWQTEHVLRVESGVSNRLVIHLHKRKGEKLPLHLKAPSQSYFRILQNEEKVYTTEDTVTLLVHQLCYSNFIEASGPLDSTRE